MLGWFEVRTKPVDHPVRRATRDPVPLHLPGRDDPVERVAGFKTYLWALVGEVSTKWPLEDEALDERSPYGSREWSC